MGDDGEDRVRVERVDGRKDEGFLDGGEAGAGPEGGGGGGHGFFF